MQTRNTLLFSALALLVVVLFLADLVWGSVRIPLTDVLSVFGGEQTDTVYSEILMNFRLPKALTAVMAGAALSVAGLMLQTLFRNPLADPYILGVSSGAGLGVALVMMAAAVFPTAFITGGWAAVSAAIVGASVVLFLVVGVSFRVSNSVSLLIVGMMFGTISGSLVSVLQNFSNPDSVKLFIMWTLGSLSSVTWDFMKVLAPLIVIGLGASVYLQKRLDGLLLGENYARGLGISITRTRLLVVAVTGLLAGSITAFTGPIAFVGVAIPHIARGIFRSSAHKVLLPACMLLGVCLLLLCDMVSQLPTYTLPVNTISALFGAPVIIWIILKKRKS